MRILFGAMIFLTLPCLYAQGKHNIDIPALSGAVVDPGQFISNQTKTRLDAQLKGIWQSGGPQIAVLVTPSLSGLSIEEYSIAVVDQWQLGDKSKDNGVLFLIAPNERRMRIEVGQGLEGELTDLQTTRILDHVVRPALRAGDFDRGVVDGVNAILTTAGVSSGPETSPSTATNLLRHSGLPHFLNRLLVDFICFVLLMFLTAPFWIFSMLRNVHRGRRGAGSAASYYSSSGWGSSTGSSWGGGSSGGGFGGGGGGFSGGGGSGSW